MPDIEFTPMELASLVVSNMDYTELHECAIIGLTKFYEDNPDNFEYDLFNETGEDAQ